MNGIVDISNEKAAAEAFSRQAPLFDDLYASDTITRYKRKRVREHIMKLLKPGSSILELNAGTGDDAIYFALQGHKVHATDISEGMQRVLHQKVVTHDLAGSISNEICSFTDLKRLFNRGPFDAIFSNFAGLNCTDELEKVLASLNSLIKPGGLVTLVILPKFCLWETMMLFRGKFKTAFRRWTGVKGAKAKVEGQEFRCWYYNPSFVRKALQDKFEMVSLEGLCTIAPPSYLERFADKHPKAWRYLEKKESQLKSKWPWKNIGDYYIISLRKKL